MTEQTRREYYNDPDGQGRARYIQTQPKVIHTAMQGAHMSTTGSIEAGGLIGEAHVVANGAENIIAICKLQDQGINVEFQSTSEGAA